MQEQFVTWSVTVINAGTVVLNNLLCYTSFTKQKKVKRNEKILYLLSCSTCSLSVPSNGDSNVLELLCATKIQSSWGTPAASAAGQACKQIPV